MHDDASLLRRYATRRDEAAFSEFVRRHIDAVYSIALRRAGLDTHLAEDIVQQVFVAVSRDATRLADHPVLIGWLHTATRYAAANTLRHERRRKNREQQAHAMNDEPASSTPETDWPQVASVLEEAIDTLDESDRVAVLLRFIDRRSFADIGATLGVAESVEARVARLEALVGLTPEQKARAAEIFRREIKALDAFAPGEERATKGMESRQGSRAEVRAILTPEQRRKYDVSPQTLGGGLRFDPANLVARLDQVVTLSTEQKQKSVEIFWDEIVDQVSSLPPEEQLSGFRWNNKVRDRLRAVLTPEQKAAFDQTPPYKKNPSPTGL